MYEFVELMLSKQDQSIFPRQQGTVGPPQRAWGGGDAGGGDAGGGCEPAANPRLLAPKISEKRRNCA